MAKNTTTAAAEAATNSDAAQVVSTTEQEAKRDQSAASVSFVPVASMLQRGYTFRNLKTTADGRYTIPGKDFDKRGVNGVPLMLPGGAILVRVPHDVWEEIKATKQNLPIFKHQPPYLQELKQEADFKAKMNAGEFAEVRTGFEPISTKLSTRQVAVQQTGDKKA